MKNKSLIVVVFIIIFGLTIYFSRSSNLEKVAVDYGFKYVKSDVGAYTGYYLEMDTTPSEYCKQRKTVSIYPGVREYIGNKIDYYCENSSSKIYEYEYDVDTKELRNVEGGSMYVDELDLTTKQQQQYKKVFDTEFSEFNTKFVAKYDELNM